MPKPAASGMRMSADDDQAHISNTINNIIIIIIVEDSIKTQCYLERPTVHCHQWPGRSGPVCKDSKRPPPLFPHTGFV